MCKVCAGELDNWGGGGLFGALPEEVVKIRQKGGKVKKEKMPGASQKGENAMAEGLKLLFGGMLFCVVNKKYSSIQKVCGMYG